MAPKPASIKVRALQWLAQREHSRIELRGKLLRLMPEDTEPAEAASEVDALLDWLSTHGHLSQERFVESRVNARQSRFGNLRIQRELQMHGASLDASARQALRDTELDRAREVWRKKYGAMAGGQVPADAAARVRQMRYLSGRGFTPEVIRRVVKEGDMPEESSSQDPDD
ncbi:regulatory protein RecX [Aquabacterium sp.]|uniref:regulatory protein RecX n=1 Tax=Aquabacterium sp. TaxID=1872578 RepID=UPI002BAD57C5|nr:regulatory protein RecX [Aquabacterium sp.]HSW08624.1 regulatory protein RecX [Aquabacterium sp.]